MKCETVYASMAGVPLDSDVLCGGGTDATVQLQKILDRADDAHALHLILDGAALVRGLKIHANTTIECPSQACGLYLADHSDCPILQNSLQDVHTIRQSNISILGGTYNHNCRHQAHDVPCPEGIFHRVLGFRRWVVAFDFIGVSHFTVRDVTICNQRSFSCLLINWQYVCMENITIHLPDHMDAQNQDGINIWGPGRFLTLRNLTGRSGDDLLAITPDQLDGVSGIEDVLIDGIKMDFADQGIRLLSRGTGRLDRVTIRNVSGTYRSFGFYINPWFPDGEGGNFGSIFIENVDLRQETPNYTYTEPMLFRLGGNIERITFSNIFHHSPGDARQLFQLGIPCCEIDDPAAPRPDNSTPQHIQTVIIDGLTVTNDQTDADLIAVYDRVDRLVLRHVLAVREREAPAGNLVWLAPGAGIGKLYSHDVTLENFISFTNAPDQIGSASPAVQI